LTTERDATLLEWDFERFLRTGKARFEALYLGFGTLNIERLE
jgi:hypothetical protein